MREDVDTLDPYRSGNTLQWEAFESVPPGHVLVVDSYGNTAAASGGDMLVTRAWKRGAAAIVTDGGLRDGHVLAKLPFPTYARTVTITTRAAAHHVPKQASAIVLDGQDDRALVHAEVVRRDPPAGPAVVHHKRLIERWLEAGQFCRGPCRCPDWFRASSTAP